MFKRTASEERGKHNMKEEMKLQFSPRPFSRLVVVCGCLAAAMTFVANNSVAAFLEYSGSAYGTYAFVGSTVTVGKTAPVNLGSRCGTPQVGLTASGTVASLYAGTIAQTGAVNTNAATALNKATASSDVHQINLLSGQIVGSEVKAVSTITQDNTGFHLSAMGSSLVNVIVAGTPIIAVPAPNTTIQLLGFGRVVLNEQIVSGNASSQRLTVNMIHVYVTTTNVLNIPVGTQIIVADASSYLTQVGGPASLDGQAYGTTVLGSTLYSGATAPISVGCQGNSLQTITLLGINVPNVLSTGTIQTTAQGSVATTGSNAQTTASIQTVNALNGTIKAGAINAQANASTTDGMTLNFTTSGSFVNLSVSGHPEITANVAANTQVSLAGIGTLYLKRVIQNSNSIEIRMIEVVLAPGNVMGLPAGTDVIVSEAATSLHTPTHP